MNRSIFLAAVATMAASTAMAQSSVNLYGRINPTVERVKIGSEKITELRDNGSFLGFKGVEDLGGGLRASFLLEAQFNPDDGRAGSSANQGGSFFGRESWVAIGSESLGRFRFGNVQFSGLYYATADYVSQHNGDFGTSADAFFLYVGTTKNTIAYTSPSLAGLTMEAQFGLGEKTSNGLNETTKNTRTIAFSYDNGPLHAGLGYVKGSLTGQGRLVNVGTPFFGFTDLVANPNDTNLNPINDSETYGARILYEITPSFNIGGYVNRDKLDDGTTSTKRTSFRISSKYSVGANDFHVNVGKANRFSGFSETAAEQYTVAYNYNLSKRTSFYAYYTRIENDDNVFYGPAFNNTTAGAPGDNFSSFAIGLRHTF